VSSPEKPKEFWIYTFWGDDGHADHDIQTTGIDEADDYLHVIEKSAYDKAINTLKYIESSKDLQAASAWGILKELGEIE